MPEYHGILRKPNTNYNFLRSTRGATLTNLKVNRLHFGKLNLRGFPPHLTLKTSALLLGIVHFLFPNVPKDSVPQFCQLDYLRQIVSEKDRFFIKPVLNMKVLACLLACPLCVNALELPLASGVLILSRTKMVLYVKY